MDSALDSPAALLPDRGGTILALGIIGLPLAFLGIPLGVQAWRMAAFDLKAMELGFVDPAGRTATQAGRVFGILGTVIVTPFLVMFLLTMLVALAGALFH
jgi:hypothetical protein